MSREVGQIYGTGIQLDARTIQIECKRRGWNQGDLARHCGISRPTISVAYRGGAITARTARQILYAFDNNRPILDGLLRKVS